MQDGQQDEGEQERQQRSGDCGVRDNLQGKDITMLNRMRDKVDKRIRKKTKKTKQIFFFFKGIGHLFTLILA